MKIFNPHSRWGAACAIFLPLPGKSGFSGFGNAAFASDTWFHLAGVPELEAMTMRSPWTWADASHTVASARCSTFTVAQWSDSASGSPFFMSCLDFCREMTESLGRTTV